jgi:hypothetical protein
MAAPGITPLKPFQQALMIISSQKAWRITRQYISQILQGGYQDQQQQIQRDEGNKR